MTPVSRYTRFVALIKRFLWVLVAGIVGLVVWIASGIGDKGARMVFSHIPKSENLENIMSKPHYQGIDLNNNPYTVIAEKAVQQDKDTVLLSTISADMARPGDKWVALTARSGTLNTETKQMTLTGGVNLFYEGGYEFESDHAQVDINKGAAYGDSPVNGRGPLGTLKADSFEIRDRGDSIRFNGSVRMKLYP